MTCVPFVDLIQGGPEKKPKGTVAWEKYRPKWVFSGPFAKMGWGKFRECQFSPEKTHGNKYKAYRSILANFAVLVFLQGYNAPTPKFPNSFWRKEQGVPDVQGFLRASSAGLARGGFFLDIPVERITPYLKSAYAKKKRKLFLAGKTFILGYVAENYCGWVVFCKYQPVQALWGGLLHRKNLVRLALAICYRARILEICDLVFNLKLHL